MPTLIVALAWRWIYEGSPNGLLNLILIDYFHSDTVVQWLANPQPRPVVGHRGGYMAGNAFLDDDVSGRAASDRT